MQKGVMSPWLIRNDSQIEEVGLEVKGQIPKWLSGSFVRNGPGTYKGMNHMFDGYAMLAKFSFSDGRAVYSNR